MVYVYMDGVKYYFLNYWMKIFDILCHIFLGSIVSLKDILL